jgi:hypothetical protein
LTCGAEDEPARAIEVRVKSERRKHLRSVDEDMRISGLAMRTPDCKGNDPSKKRKDLLITGLPCSAVFAAFLSELGG